MLLNLTDLHDEPLQGQIYRQIRAKILSGELPAEISLPSIRVLAREQHVSVITVQRAYERLIQDNLIHARRGKGFFVSDLTPDEKREMAKKRLFDKMSPHITSSLAEGLKKEEISEIVENILDQNSE